MQCCGRGIVSGSLRTVIGFCRHSHNMDHRLVVRTVRDTLRRIFNGTFHYTKTIHIRVSHGGLALETFHGCVTDSARLNTVCVPVRGTHGVQSSTIGNARFRIRVPTSDLKQVNVRGTHRVVLRGLERTRHIGMVSGCGNGINRVVVNAIHAIAHGNSMVLSVRGTSTVLRHHSYLPASTFTRNSAMETVVTGMLPLRRTMRRDAPTVVLSHTDSSFLHRLFMARISRVGSKAIRVVKITESPNSHSGVSIHSCSPGVSPINTYINLHNIHIHAVIDRLNNRGVSVVG